MKFNRHDICASLIVVSLIACTAVSVIRKPRLMSEKENRELAALPQVTVEKIFNGTFMKEFETYTADQFVLRDVAVSVKANSELILGKKGNNGVHFGKNGYLIARPLQCNAQNIANNINSLNALQKRGGFNVTMALVPTAFEIKKDNLPANAYNRNIIDIMDTANEFAKDTNIKVCDVTPDLEKHKDEYIYYRTDHHQTALGSYYTYESLGAELGYTPYKLDSFKRDTVATDFLGTTWSKASILLPKADTVETFTLCGGIEAKTTFPLEDKSIPGMYVKENADKKDKYTIYLDGNHALTVIDSENKSGKELLIFKDSYAHSIAPFLANHYDKIHLIDMRYFNSDPIEYIAENNITDILVLYSADTFSEDTNLTKIGEWLEVTEYYQNPPYGVLEEQTRVEDDYFADAVMFGDSLTYAHSAFSSLPFKFISKSAVNTITVHTETVESGRTVIGELLATEGINKYYLMLGINEVSYRAHDSYINDYARIIDMIREKNPDAIIYIQSIMPIERSVEARAIYKHQIDSANTALMELAVQKDCYYLAVNTVIAEADGYLRDGAAQDGVHFDKKDHDKWEEYLKTHAVGKTGRATATKTVNVFAGNGKLDYNKYAQDMLKAVGFKDKLSPVKDSIIARMYGLEENEALGGLVYVSGGSTAEEFAIFETDSPEKAIAIGEKLKARVEKRKPDFKTYKPAEMAKLNNPLIIVDGNVAMLCITDNIEKAKSVMEKY